MKINSMADLMTKSPKACMTHEFQILYKMRLTVLEKMAPSELS